MGSASQPGSYADTAKRLAGRSLLAVGSGLARGTRLVAKGVSVLTADNSDKEPVRFLKFSLLEWGGTSGGSGNDSGEGAAACCRAGEPACRLPVLLVGLATGFQVWRLDGPNPTELISRRDGAVKLLEALPQPRGSEREGGEDALPGDRPLLAVVPAPERPACAAPAPASGGQQVLQPQQQQQHTVLLYSLHSHGYVRTMSFSGEVLGLAASPHLLVVALRGQLQAFDAGTLEHTFSCLTYTLPSPPALPASGGAASRGGQQQQQQFVTGGLVNGVAGSGSAGAQQQAEQRQQQAEQPAAALAPFALGARWLAYASDAPVPPASSQAVAQRLPLGRRDSSNTTGASGELDADVSSSAAAPGTSPSGRGMNGVTTSAVADAALQVAVKGGQQLRVGLTAMGSASFRYLSGQYQAWRKGGGGGGQGQQGLCDLDALEADAAVAGTVVVRDAASRLVVARFRAHTSPLAALQFSPGGTLLATASVAGHSIHVFRIVPPAPLAVLPAATPSADVLAGGGAGGAGHAVHLYRLHRGLTPAAIRGISWAPDARWVAVLSGRGTTHLFHTPAAAPGGSVAPAGTAAHPEAAAVQDNGVAGQPIKLGAASRARKPGLLSGGVAGAATSAARNLYAGQPADAAPIAAAFLAAGPSSLAAAPALSAGPTAAGSSLYVVTSDGLLTRHLMHAPPAQHPTAAGSAGLADSPGADGGPASVVPGCLDRQDSAAAGGAAPLAVLEEAERWDVARHASWPEREELLPGLLPPANGPHPPPAAPPGWPAAAGAGAGASYAEQQQLWVAQAESGALAAPGAAGAAPLWQDPQFRFYELQLQSLSQRRQQPQQPEAAWAEPAPAGAGAGAAGTEALAAQLEAAGLSAGHAAWLESIPARPIHP